MVLQLTDFTSEITDEELREFTSEYYIPSALHPVVPAASASIADFPVGKVGVYTRFFEFANQLVPRLLSYLLVKRMGIIFQARRAYSMEDAELINENRIPINAYSEAFLCHMGISRNYFQSPEEVPTFIGDDGREMDLFSVVHFSKPKGVRPLRDGEEPLLESTAGRTMELVLEQPEVESLSTSTEEETPDASPTLAAKEVTETPPPNVEATSDSSAPVTHAAQSPPQSGPKAFEGLLTYLVFLSNVQLKCESCGEVTDKETCVSLNEEVDLPKRGVTNLVQKCKFCKREGTVTMIPKRGFPLTRGYSDAGKYAPLMAFDCRGFEPLEYAFSSDWEAQAVAGSKFGTKFVDIDLSGGDFSEYCEENKVPVMISNLRSEFRVVDMTKRIV
ncbi:gypsy type transposase [Tanacetum coccineum]|uniref:Gypsy type transposase n=1 Tax=Tanacetum coccineum TaxID=301880 RepID=A0ABQ5IBM7_9ASTR